MSKQAWRGGRALLALAVAGGLVLGAGCEDDDKDQPSVVDPGGGGGGRVTNAVVTVTDSSTLISETPVPEGQKCAPTVKLWLVQATVQVTGGRPNGRGKAELEVENGGAGNTEIQLDAQGAATVMVGGGVAGNDGLDACEVQYEVKVKVDRPGDGQTSVTDNKKLK